MKVLYIDGVGQFGGASRSLYELVRQLREYGVAPCFIAARGSVQRYYDEVSDKAIYAGGLSRFNNSITGYYRGFRWLVLLREIRNIPGTVLAVRRAKEELGRVDLIHINEIHDLPIGLVAKYFFRAPMIVHLRCCQRSDLRSWRVRVFHWLLRRYAAKAIAIDQNTRATLPSDIDVAVVHNSLSVDYKPPFEKDHSRLLAGAPLSVGFIGNLMRSKGVLDLVEAVGILKARKVDVRLHLVGGRLRQLKGMKRAILKLFDVEEDVLPEVEQLIAERGLQELITLHGHVGRIQELIPTFNVLAFPSYFDAPGRPIFEAAFFKVPSLSCVSAPREDTVVPGETGLVVPPRNPESLADAIEYYACNRHEAIRMGNNAYALAWRNFVPETNALKVLRIYNYVLKTDTTR